MAMPVTTSTAPSVVGAGASTAHVVSTADDRPRTLVIIGPTGCGKTQLAVDLALLLGNAEIINCDVIQMYRGLDIASAKATLADRAGVPHHMMSFLEPREHFTVRTFKTLADAIIRDIHSRGKLPIVVGGTMYYAQSLLRESLLEEEEIEEAKAGTIRDAAAVGSAHLTAAAVDGRAVDVGHDGADSPVGEGASCSTAPDSNLCTPDAPNALDLHARLAAVDPVMAERLHPRDTRKIQRALEVFEATGTPYSSVILHQSKKRAGGKSTYNALVLYPQVRERDVHDRRLDARVKKMLHAGLLQEIKALAAHLRGVSAEGSDLGEGGGDVPSDLTKRCWEACRLSDSDRGPPDLSSVSNDADITDGSQFQGLLQAIGFKEFSEYLDLLHTGALSATEQSAVESDVMSCVADTSGHLSAQPPFPDQARRALYGSIHRLLDVTHRYVRVQERFIRNRFEKRGLQLHDIDTSDSSTWASAIVPRAHTICVEWLAGRVGACDACVPPSETPSRPSAPPSDAESIFSWKKYTCDVCERTLNGEHEWRDHLESKGHKSAVKYQQLRASLAEARGIVLPRKRKRSKSRTGDPDEEQP